MLDRTQAPPVKQVSNITLPEIESHELYDGGKLYIHREKNTNAFKVEILANAGNTHAPNAELVQLTMKMLAEGTTKKSGHQLSEHIDSIGSFLEISPGFDNSSIGLFGLKKYFKENIQLLAEMLYSPAFSAQSLDTLRQKEKNKLKLNLEKGSYLSSVNLRASLFSQHPYGYRISLEGIENISIEDIREFHNNYVKAFEIYLSGDIPEDATKIVSTIFNHGANQINKPQLSHEGITIENSIVRDEKYIQSSIKLGKRLFNRTHQDYLKFMLANEILGGYFGSRLMKNIREDKGFTYGIYSSLYSLKQSGYFLISTDVKGTHEQETLQEIQKEIEQLQNELVTEQELETVKNYMCGSFINSFSSPFSSITKFKTLNTQGIPFEFYNSYINQILDTSSNDVLHLANEYIQFPSLVSSIVGS